MSRTDGQYTDPDAGPLLTKVPKRKAASSSITDLDKEQQDNDSTSAMHHGLKDKAFAWIAWALAALAMLASTLVNITLVNTPVTFANTGEDEALDEALCEEVDDTALGDLNDRKIFVDLLDTGGQLSFSVIRTVSFSAEQSMFVLVYNSSIPLMKKIDSEFWRDGTYLPAMTLTNGDHLRLWLSTVAMLKAPSEHSPVVVVVGTFCESNDDKSFAELQTLLTEFKDRLDVRGPYFVDNSRPRADNMKRFRQVLASLIEEQATRTAQEVPLSYLKCEWYVRRYETAEHQTVAQFATFVKHFAQIQLGDVPALLHYLHAHCAVRFFDFANSKRGEAIVYLNVPWLLKQVCKLLSCTMNEPPSDCRQSVVNDIDLLKTKGILTTRLANHLWSDDSARTQFQDDLLCILDKLGLQCPIPPDAAQALLNVSPDSGPLYFVPICIQTDESGLSGDLDDDFEEAVPPLLLSTDPLFFPYGEFSRLVVRLLQRYKPPISTVQISFRYLRFQLTGVTPCYAVEVTHAQQGAAIVLKCTLPNVATGSAGDGYPMAVCATRFFESVRCCIDSMRAEGCHGLTLAAAFYCAEHTGR